MTSETHGPREIAEVQRWLHEAAADHADLGFVGVGLAAALRWARGANYLEVERFNPDAHRPARSGGGGTHLVLRRSEKRVCVEVSTYDGTTQVRSEVERLLRRLGVPRSTEARAWPRGRLCVVVPGPVAEVLLARTRPRRCAFWMLAQSDESCVFEVLPVADALEGAADIPPPSPDHSRPPQWDTYWRYRTAGEVAPGDRVPVADAVFLRYLFEQSRPELDRRTARILCVGNGLSILPHALGAAGFPVTVLEWSAVALDHCRDNPPTSDELQTCFGLVCEEFGLPTYQDFLQEDGSVVWIEGDIFDPTACTGPYDLIVATRFFERLPAFDVRSAVTRLDERLGRDGWCWVAVQNSGFRWIEVQREFQGHGFAVVPYARIPATGKAMAGGLLSG